MLYSFGISVYYFLIRVASLFSNKARFWVRGRKDIPSNPNNLSNVVIVHCASYGEYEQALPFVEAYHHKFPQENIVVSFFSPSGFEKVKLPSFVKEKIYLPRDYKKNIIQLIQNYDLKKLVLVKYELWRNLISVCQAYNVETHLICGRFYANHRILRPWSKNLLKLLKKFNSIHLIDESSFKMLSSLSFNNLFLSGDTRFDRVTSLEVPKRIKAFSFDNNLPCLILGSLWKSDWNQIGDAVLQLGENYNLIIAPHEVDASTISFFKEELRVNNKASVLWSTQPKQADNEVLIIDTIGDLKYLYSIANIAYIGGGFQKGLHNILEPLSFEIPVLIGPQYHRFSEVIAAVESNITVPIDYDFMTSFKKANKIKPESIKNFLGKHVGAAKRIIEQF